MNEVLTCVDLFCGAGGLTEGLETAGFKAVFAIDHDEQAMATYRWNHPFVKSQVANVSNMHAEDVLAAANLKQGELDLLTGGPPCQGFSVAGLRLPDDPKNRLYLEFVRLTRELKPKAVLMENVKGIQSMQRGQVVRALSASMRDIGYEPVTGILNAAEFGVPQSRPRFIMIALQKGSASLPAPTHNPSTPLTVQDALWDLPLIQQGEGSEEMSHLGSYATEYQKARRGRRQPGLIFNHRATCHSQRIIDRYSMIPQGSTNAVVPAELRTRKANVYRLREDLPARTVTCNFRTDLLHPWVPRGLTVREAARLQSFDDDYRFFGNLTRKARWVTQDDQVGNAVPPLLAAALGRHIRGLLSMER